MIKPVGATCNLACTYCYYLPVAEQYASPARRMSIETLDTLLAGYLPDAPHQVTLSWQGGEPTLAGLEWFKQMIEVVDLHRRPDQTVSHCLQTNGTRLDDAWCRFLKHNQFLVGISLDGLLDDHDHYRVDRHGRGTFNRVMAGLTMLRSHGVEHNVLVVLNDRTVLKPRELWRQLMALRVDWVQFIPAIEWVPPSTGQSPSDPDTWALAPFSPSSEAFGRFLCTVFDDWFEYHRPRVSVRTFDAILGALVTGRPGECTFAPSCAGQLTVEHDGSIFACDHFVEPHWQVGHATQPFPSPTVGLTVNGRPTQPNHRRSPVQWMQRIDRDRFDRFGRRKADLDGQCNACRYKAICHGGCPKHRPARGDLPGPTVLCEGYRAFFDHAMPRLEWMATHLRVGHTPPPCPPRELRPDKTRPRFKRRRKR